MVDEIITPNGAEKGKSEDVPPIHLNMIIDGVETPVEISKHDRMILTKVEFFCEQWWITKKSHIWDRWKNILVGAGSTGLMLLSAYLGRVSA